jgi:hypothetical protein
VGVLGRSMIRTRRENFHGGSAGLLMLSEGLEIEPTHYEAENKMLIGNYLQQLVENVIAGISTILEVNSMCFLVYILFLHEFHSQGIYFGLRLFASSPE